MGRRGSRAGGMRVLEVERHIPRSKGGHGASSAPRGGAGRQATKVSREGKARPRESHALFEVSALRSLPHGRPPCRRKIITMELLAVPEGELTSHLQDPHPVRVAATPWAARLVAGTLRRVDTLSKEATTHRPRSRRTVACRQAVVATMAMRLLNQCISSVRNKAVVMQHRAAVPAWPRCSPAAVSKSSAWPFCTRYTPPSNKAVLHSP